MTMIHLVLCYSSMLFRCRWDCGVPITTGNHAERREGGWLEFLSVSEYSFVTEGKDDTMILSLASVSALRDLLESSVSAELDGENDCLIRSFVLSNSL